MYFKPNANAAPPQAWLPLASENQQSRCADHIELIEQGVRSRCHCIPFNAAPPPAWLPLAHRIIADAGISGITDQQLLSVIATGKGSARDITDALMSVVLDAMRVKQ